MRTQRFVWPGLALILALFDARGEGAKEMRVNDLLSQMTLDEKIGQMVQVDSGALADKADVKKYFLGSVLSGGGSDPADGNSPQLWLDQVAQFQNEALQTRLKIPLLYGIDAVHGHNNIDGAVIFPHHIGMGATHDPQLVERAERVTAEEVAGTGIRWAFAPCITVLISGRPLILGSALENSDAFVAAWLPGTEGEGVADVLFGDCKPTGKLPRLWPRDNDQLSADNMTGKPLFPFGFGLTY